MTLTGTEDNQTVEDTSMLQTKNTAPVMEIGQSVQQILVQARDQGRLTCGVNECTELLQIDPSEVMFCVLPENFKGDVSLHIHFTLLEAFCWENDIRVLKVDSVDKMGVALVTCFDDDVTQQRELNSADYSCALVEYPDEVSKEEEQVLEYYKMTCDVFPQPVVELPG